MKLIVSFAVMIFFVVIGNLYLKNGAVMATTQGDSWINLLNWRVVTGLCSYGLAVILYILMLRTTPLYLAQTLMAAQFIAIILASAYILHEPISYVQWIGISLIAFGIFIVGISQG